MTIQQIYSIVNSIKSNMTTGGTNVVDASSFVSFGGDVLSSSTNKEQFYSLLVDRIGRTKIAIDNYSAKNRHVMVDSFKFGSILQKISYSLQDSETEYIWSDSAQNPYTLTKKGGVIQKLFAQNMPVFCYTDVLLDEQLASAFTDASAMASFINGIIVRMNNAFSVSVEGLQTEAINKFVAKVFAETQAQTPTNARRTRNLLTEYNSKFSKALTMATCLADADFLKYCCVEMGTVIPFMSKLTKMYNDGTVERATDENSLVVELNTEFEKSYAVYLQSDTFHDELVKLPNYTTVPYWHTPSAPMTIAVDNGNDTTTTITGIIGVFRDEECVVATIDDDRFISKYDEWNDRTYIKRTAGRRYVADTSENCVIFYIGSVTTE